jgi:hypothetical protein
MTGDELTFRVRRIYAAIDAVQEFDLAKVPARVISTPHVYEVMQDFRGGMSEEEIANSAYTLIHNIANLRDHLRRWAARNWKDKEKVDATFAASLELRIIQDLSNNDKHGPARDGGNSGLAPQLKEINRLMRLATKGVQGSCAGFFLDPSGKPNVLGDGSASVVITGQVVDKDGKVLGDLFEIEEKAVLAWETLLAEYGVEPVHREGDVNLRMPDVSI